MEGWWFDSRRAGKYNNNYNILRLLIGEWLIVVCEEWPFSTLCFTARVQSVRATQSPLDFHFASCSWWMPAFQLFLLLAQQDELRSILWIYRFANLGCSIFGDFGIRIFGCRIAKDLELRIVSIVRNNAPGRFRRFETNLFHCIPAGCIIVVHKFIPNTLDNTPAMFTLINNAIKSNYRHFNHLFTLWNNNNRRNVVDKFIVVTSWCRIHLRNDLRRRYYFMHSCSHAFTYLFPLEIESFLRFRLLYVISACVCVGVQL